MFRGLEPALLAAQMRIPEPTIRTRTTISLGVNIDMTLSRGLNGTRQIDNGKITARRGQERLAADAMQIMSGQLDDARSSVRTAGEKLDQQDDGAVVQNLA